ncbi:hypothetical protein ACH5RR_005386 [Cinchona calisaya]|uniref:Uncharacterized protein n=1 Tax=Cinchona calisaya TaxID=153742 RepID=A0ABD3AL25_9GENT
MSTTCISNCVNDTRFPIRRANYVNLHKWPESDAEFAKMVGSTENLGGEGQLHYLHPRPRVVDSVSCRQLYLRSAYTFSRKESVPERTKKCFGRVRERITIGRTRRKFRCRRRRTRTRTRFVIVKRMKQFSCEALRSLFQKLLSCTATVDVVEHSN